jgi:hypothetical protein
MATITVSGALRVFSALAAIIAGTSRSRAAGLLQEHVAPRLGVHRGRPPFQ